MMAYRWGPYHELMIEFYIYPVIWKILGLFSSPTNREIDHPLLLNSHNITAYTHNPEFGFRSVPAKPSFFKFGSNFWSKTVIHWIKDEGDYPGDPESEPLKTRQNNWWFFFSNASWVWETPLLKVSGKSKVCCSNGRCRCQLVPRSRFI